MEMVSNVWNDPLTEDEIIGRAKVEGAVILSDYDDQRSFSAADRLVERGELEAIPVITGTVRYRLKRV